MNESILKAISFNIGAMLDGENPSEEAIMNPFYLTDFGDRGIGL